MSTVPSCSHGHGTFRFALLPMIRMASGRLGAEPDVRLTKEIKTIRHNHLPIFSQTPKRPCLRSSISSINSRRRWKLGTLRSQPRLWLMILRIRHYRRSASHQRLRPRTGGIGADTERFPTRLGAPRRTIDQWKAHVIGINSRLKSLKVKKFAFRVGYARSATLQFEILDTIDNPGSITLHVSCFPVRCRDTLVGGGHAEY